jgi:hypothetical protein
MDLRMIFQVSTAMKMRTEVCWVIILCSLVCNYQCFRGTHHLHLQCIRSKDLKMKTNVATKNKAFSITNTLKIKIAVFWVVAPCSLVEIYQRFRGPCCLHHQGDE